MASFSPDGLRQQHHPRNPYAKRRPDFAALARADADFATFVRGRQLDWSDSAALIALSRTLLLHDFGIRWELPAHSLCPTVPSRLDYLLWLQDLLRFHSATDPRRTVHGVDIGTGASCIYPLLGHAHLGWRFVATEVDPASVEAARHNVDLNGWHDAISIRQVPRTSPSSDVDDSSMGAGGARRARHDASGGGGAPVLAGILAPDERFDFCMCNPPWYDESEVPRPNLALRPDGRRCEATASELFTAGGEAGFVARLVEESATLRERVVWYTSLLGRKRSLAPILRAVRTAGARHIRSAELRQGGTSRWVIGWSFVEGAAPQLTAPPKPAARSFDAPIGVDAAEVVRRVHGCVAEQGGELLDASGDDDAAGEGDIGEEADAPRDESLAPAPSRGHDRSRLLAVRARFVVPTAPSCNSSSSSSSSGDRAGGKRAALNATDSTVGGVMAEAAVGRKRDRPSTLDSDSDPHSSTPPGEWHVKVWTTAAAEQQEGGEAEEAAAVAAGRRAAVGVHVELAALSRPDLTAAFWRLAEAMRNDVVRDTRRWRRAAARGGAGAGTAS